MFYLSLVFSSAMKEFFSLFRLSLLNKSEMVLIFIVCLRHVATSHLYFPADCPSLFPSLISTFCDWLYLTVLLALFSFPCLSPGPHFSLTLAHPLLYHTLILCDVRLITLPLFLSVSLFLSVVWKWLWWMVHYVLCGVSARECVCVWEWWWWYFERQVIGEARGAATDRGISVSSFISSI